MTVLTPYLPQLLAGAWLTIQLALCALVAGLALGLLGAFAKLSHIAILRRLATGFTTIIRGVPELIVIFTVYYGAAPFLNLFTSTQIEINSFTAGVIALALIFGAYATETFRGAVLSINVGQIEAAHAYGFNRWKSFVRIIFPQMCAYALPGLGNLWFVLLKDTALVSLIGAADLMFSAETATASTKQPFTFYMAAAIMYLIFTSISLVVLRYFEKRQQYVGVM